MDKKLNRVLVSDLQVRRTYYDAENLNDPKIEKLVLFKKIKEAEGFYELVFFRQPKNGKTKYAQYTNKSIPFLLHGDTKLFTSYRNYDKERKERNSNQ